METDWIGALGILLRFVHVLAAIMWIGNSLLFTWMELSLVAPDPEKDDPDLLGTLDMLHGGGVFHLQKRVMRPEAIPERLHWFKWQSYTTWMTGFALLCALFYSGQGSTLLDATKTNLPEWAGVLLSLTGIVGGWFVYDRIWRSPLKNHLALGTGLTFLLLIATAWGFNQIFNGRAVYLQIGAMMGTLMSANVFFHIMTNQRRFMAALREGQPHDLALGKQAKQRSLHNHYLTFPVLFLMLSAHFPQLCGAEWNVPILAVLIAGLVAVKYLMNARHWQKNWLPALMLTVWAGSAAIYLLAALPAGFHQAGWLPPASPGHALFVSEGCATCHMQGSSQIAPNLHGIYGREQPMADGSRVTVDDTYLEESILHPQARVVKGFAPAMPSYEGRLSPGQLSELIGYIRSIGPKPVGN